MGVRRCASRVLVVKREGKRSLGRHWQRWQENVKVDL
jgi:hypothetical protein